MARSAPQKRSSRPYLLQTIERFNRHEMRPPESPGFTPDADFINVQRQVDEGRR